MIWIALSFGLLSSLHCVAMCGPLQAVVMGQWLQSGARYHWGIYHLGRLFTYAVLGLLAASFGQALGVPHWQGNFSLIAGLLLLFGYFGFKALHWDRKFMALLSPFLQKLRPGVEGKKGLFWYASSGALNGLLPCGMVYAALLPAMAAKNPAWGAAYMLAFGAGTLPLLLGFNLFSQQILLRFGRYFHRLIPLSIIIIATLLILRGLHLDIPLLSPELPKAGASVETCG